MGKFKDTGDCFLTLAEECNELSQAILKKYRFMGEWNDVVEDKGLTRKAIVMDEMIDVLYQMERCYKQFGLEFNWEIESIDDNDPIDDSEHQFIADLEEWEMRRRMEEEEMERQWMEMKKGADK